MKRIKNNFKQHINLVKSIATNPNKFVTQLVYGNIDLPFSFREFLNKIKNESITSLHIIRAPISNTTMNLMNVFSGFQLQQKLKQSSYDSLFHLKLRINGKYDLEKEQVPKLDFSKNTPNQELLQILQIPNITIWQFIDNVIKYMGIKQFLHYNGSTNNCQVFILNILHANNIHGYDDFIKQDTSFVFEHNPFLRKLMNTVTDIGRATVQLEEGTGIVKTKKRKKLNTLTNNDIISICMKLEIPLKGVFMKDELKPGLQDGNYIMNLQNHNQNGSHWIGFIKYAGIIYYHDSFGVVMPQNEYDLFKSESDNVYYSTQIHQKLDATSCGWWAIMFLHWMKYNKGNMLCKFKSFNKLFSKDLVNNEKILLNYFNKIM